MLLGKLAPRDDPRTLQLANYLTGELPKPPYRIQWSKAVTSWPMMANDRVGDCTCAAAGHMIQAWTANAGESPFRFVPATGLVLTDAEILAAYGAITGYRPDDPSTDRGAVELDVLNYWRKTGVGGHQIAAYAALEPQNRQHVELGVDLFGGVYIGLALPLSAQQQRVWSVPPGGLHGKGQPGSWGGHAVPVLDYDAHGLTCVTWGSLKRMTWGFWAAYCDEAYALVSQDWIAAAGKAPSGFDLAELQADLAAITK